MLYVEKEALDFDAMEQRKDFGPISLADLMANLFDNGGGK